MIIDLVRVAINRRERIVGAKPSYCFEYIAVETLSGNEGSVLR